MKTRIHNYVLRPGVGYYYEQSKQWLRDVLQHLRDNCSDRSSIYYMDTGNAALIYFITFQEEQDYLLFVLQCSEVVDWDRVTNITKKGLDGLPWCE